MSKIVKIILAVNLLGHSRGFKASTERIATAFDGRSLIFPSCSSGNTIAFATGGEPVNASLDELITRARQFHKEAGLNLLPTIPRLQANGALVEERLLI